MNFNGSIGLVKTRFDFKNIKSYLGFLIRWFTKCEYNHAVVFIVENGITWVYEAKSDGIVKSRFIDWKFDNNTEEAILLEPRFIFNKDIFEENCKVSLGIKYDFKSTLFHQAIRQMTNERLWIGQKSFEKASREMNCSEFAAYLYWLSTNKQMFENWYMIDPQDLFNANNFNITKIK